MKILVLTICALFSALASAQVALDPTQSGAYPKFPAYIGFSCGGVQQFLYDEQTNDGGTTTAAFRFYTNCNGSGRGAKDTRHQTCWAVTFAADGYIVIDRVQLVLPQSWKQGQPAQNCPVL